MPLYESTRTDASKLVSGAAASNAATPESMSLVPASFSLNPESVRPRSSTLPRQADSNTSIATRNRMRAIVATISSEVSAGVHRAHYFEWAEVMVRFRRAPAAPESALTQLETAIANGFDDLKMTRGEPSFASLRKAPRFRALR